MNIFGTEPASLTTFESKGGGGDRFHLNDNIGKGVVLTVHSIETDIDTVHGKKDAAKVDVVLLHSDGSTETFKDALIFNASPLKDLRRFVGQTIVADIGTYTMDKTGKKEHPELRTPSEATQKLAKAL